MIWCDFIEVGLGRSVFIFVYFGVVWCDLYVFLVLIDILWCDLGVI